LTFKVIFVTNQEYLSLLNKYHKLTLCGVGLREDERFLPSDTGPHIKNMLRGKLLRQTLDKFLKKSEVAANARVQVCLPNGELFDVVGIELMENKIIGNRETHRLVITIDKEKWTMGKVLRKM